jgi:predicted AAA+ superfamily ATPase
MREDRARQLQAQVRNTNEMIATLTNERDHDIFTLKSTAAALTDEITKTSCYIEGEVPEPVQPSQVDGILKELCDWYGVNGARDCNVKLPVRNLLRTHLNVR